VTVLSALAAADANLRAARVQMALPLGWHQGDPDHHTGRPDLRGASGYGPPLERDPGEYSVTNTVRAASLASLAVGALFLPSLWLLLHTFQWDEWNRQKG
jgi:hypothetical protein